jgi:hypothetical protein
LIFTLQFVTVGCVLFYVMLFIWIHWGWQQKRKRKKKKRVELVAKWLDMHFVLWEMTSPSNRTIS